jgi:phosphate starvation-inducible PhoH-like protein
MSNHNKRKKKSSQEITEQDFKNVVLKEKQQQYQKLIDEKTITVCQGPAGTSKTFTACYAALKLLSEEKFERIVLVKPIEEAGEKLGFLPGTVDEKIQPYLESYINNMGKIIGHQAVGFLMSTGKIVFKPLAYLRGVSLDYSMIMCDEAQNLDMRQLILLTTRLGHKSKLVIMGDVSQYDIKKNMLALPRFGEMIADVDCVGTFNFTEQDIVRHKILIEITKKYEAIKDQFENKKM